MDYLSEAFKQLEILNEDVFDLDKDGLEDLRDFQDEDEEEVIDVIDPEAETEEDLEDSYIGKVILDCSVCHTDIYKDKEDVIIDEETQLANVGEECPYCFSVDGFKVIGEVKPFVETEFETEDDVDVEVDGEEVEEEEDEEEKNESFKRHKKIVESISKRKLKESSLGKGEDGRYTVDQLLDVIGSYARMIERDRKENNGEYGIVVLDDILSSAKFVLKQNNYSGRYKNLVEAPVYGLEPRYDARKSFYGKAQVDTGDKGDKNKLYSYGTLVAEIKDGKPVVYGTYSATTLRHIKDWLKQNGFRADTSKQIVADYGVKDEACTGKDCARKPRKMKESKVPMMMSKKALKEGWRGTPVKIVSHGSWGDPDLVWNNGEEEYTFNYWDIEDAMWNMFLEETGHKDSESNDPKVEEEFNEYVQDNYEGYLEDVIWGGYFDEGSTNWHDRYKRESLRNRKSRKIKESIEDIKIDTGDQEITVSAVDKEKVESDDEMIAPLSDETKTDIEMNTEEEENGDEVDVDMDEFSEEEFDDLGESYLKKVYENVDSYKTTSVTEKGNKLKVEGLIKFNSGKTKKTSFVFEAKTIDKNGHAKFLGENLQISRGHKSFKLSGTVSNNKFIAESLNYNYRAKNGKSSQRVYGTVKVNKK